MNFNIKSKMIQLDVETDQQGFQMENEDDQMSGSSLKDQSQDGHILLEKNEAQNDFKDGLYESETTIDLDEETTDQLDIQEEIEEDQHSLSSFEDQSEDELEILPLWFGDPKKDTLTAEDWIESVQERYSPKHYNIKTPIKYFLEALVLLSIISGPRYPSISFCRL